VKASSISGAVSEDCQPVLIESSFDYQAAAHETGSRKRSAPSDGEIALYRVKNRPNIWHIDHHWVSCRYKKLKHTELFDRTLKTFYVKDSIEKGELVVGMKDVHVRISFENVCRECQLSFISKLRAFGTNVFFRIDDEA